MRFIRHVGVLVGLLSSVAGALAGCGGESSGRGDNTGASGGTGGSGSGATGAGSGSSGKGSSGATTRIEGPPDEATRCSTAMDCTVVPLVCCSCPAPGLADLVAIRRDGSDEFFASHCGLVDCECVAEAPASVGATCLQGRCVAVDIRETEYTECTQPTDCVLRRGLGCCENCESNGDDVIAVRKDRDIGALTCGADVDCAACATPVPGRFGVTCREGRCEAETTFP